MGIMGIFLYAGEAWAFSCESISSNGIFGKAAITLCNTFQNARNVVYVVSGFGLIGVAVGGIFGKVSFRWLAMICVALATLAAADMIVDYSINNGVEMSDDYKKIGEDDFNLKLQFDE